MYFVFFRTYKKLLSVSEIRMYLITITVTSIYIISTCVLIPFFPSPNFQLLYFWHLLIVFRSRKWKSFSIGFFRTLLFQAREVLKLFQGEIGRPWLPLLSPFISVSSLLNSILIYIIYLARQTSLVSWLTVVGKAISCPSPATVHSSFHCRVKCERSNYAGQQNI